MKTICKESDILIIVIHEIYGINQHIKDICQLLSERGFDVICPNLIKQEGAFEYSQEEIAYCHFTENIGFENASEEIISLIADMKVQYKEIYIVGFSVGATIAWLCSEEACLDGIVGYYGSRIRNYVGINPLCPTMLFFPEKEQAFNVDQLISCLEKKNIEIYKFGGQHGFSDPYSSKYNKKSAKEAFNKMVDFLPKQ